MARPATRHPSSEGAPATPVSDMREHFERQVGDYETVAEHVVIDNDRLHEELIGMLEFASDRPIRVLDLGSGTGHGMGMVLDRFPRAEAVGVDFAEKMHRRAEGLLAGKGRFTLIEADFSEPLPVEDGSFDAVVSAVSIHNVPHEEKRELFARIREWLKPGGIFANGDFFAGETAAENDEYRAVYRKYLEANLSGDELATWLHHAFEQDMPMRLAEQQAVLEALGFKSFGISWRRNNEAVYRVQKPVTESAPA